MSSVSILSLTSATLCISLYLNRQPWLLYSVSLITVSFFNHSSTESAAISTTSFYVLQSISSKWSSIFSFICWCSVDSFAPFWLILLTHVNTLNTVCSLGQKRKNTLCSYCYSPIRLRTNPAVNFESFIDGQLGLQIPFCSQCQCVWCLS